MDSESFIDVLNSVNTTSLVTSTNYTHTTLCDPIKRWSVPQPKLQQFWLGYCAANNRGEHLYVAERPNSEIAHVVFDLTFKFEDFADDHKDPYDNYFLKCLVACAQEAIEKMYVIKPDKQELTCCVMEPTRTWKDESKGNNYIVTKVRLQFPKCKVEIRSYAELKVNFIKNLRRHAVRSHLIMEPVGDWATIVDGNVVTRPVVMLGSTSNIAESRLQLSYMYGPIQINEYGQILLEEDGDDIYYDLQIDEVFHQKYHNDVRSGFVDMNIFNGTKLDQWEPMLLSMNYWIGSCILKDEEESLSRSNERTDSSKLTEDMKIAEKLMPFLNSERFTEGMYRREIGRALYDSSMGDDTGLDMWIKYTRHFLKNNKDLKYEAEKIIEKMRVDYCMYYDSRITIRTIAWYAREDNKEAYDQWHFEWCKDVIDKSVSCLHQDVAEAFYRQNWLEHICVDPTGPKWYKFNKDRLIKDPSGIGLRKKLGLDLVKLYDRRRRDLIAEKMALDDSASEKVKSEMESLLMNLTTLVACIKTESYKNSVMSCVKEFFYIEDFNFYEKIESSMDTVGLPNGVLEVFENECKFRRGKPEDYITKKMGVPYREDYTWETGTVKRYLYWLECLHRDRELCNEWRKFTASLLQGGNNEKMFPVLTGTGNNGKSMIMKLFHCAFGGYCFDYPVELLTCKNKNPQGPSPATARGKGARLALASEPDDEDPIKKGFIKKISGGDSFYGRMLNEDGGDIIASFVMALIVNEIPIVSRADEAFRKRLWILPFLSKWSDAAPDSEDEQMKSGIFKMDKFFDRKIPELAPAMLWVAVQDFKVYKKEGLCQEVRVVKEAAEKYWIESDIYYQYTNESITQRKDSSGNLDERLSLSVSQVYLNFKKWYSQCFPGSIVPDRRVFTKEISNRWGEPKKCRWYGIVFSESDVDDGDGGEKGKSVYNNFD